MGKSNSYYMQLHVEALFTMNEKNELMTIREPWDSTSQPAPRFYLTRPLYEKPHTYFRADVPKELREKLQSITNREPVLMLPNESPIYDKEYRQLLGESKISEDACFWLPEQPKLKACLLKEETLKRAVERSKLDRKTNIELVETMWEQFCNLGIYESNVVDTTNYSIQETVSAVQEKIASRAALLS